MHRPLVSALIVLAALTLAQAQPRPATVNVGGTFVGYINEGAFFDLTSNAPNGFRVNIHTFAYLPAQTATFTSEFYFKVGTSVGFEGIRWPWVNHYIETVGLQGGVFHEYRPIPLVIGEQPIGYVMFVDPNDDIRLSGGAGATYTDGILSIVQEAIQFTFPLFQPGTYYGGIRTPITYFVYTLDQFGGFAVTSAGHHVRGFDGSERLLPFVPAGVYALISHGGLAVSGRMCEARAGGTAMCEAGVVLADGHRLVLEAQAAEGSPVLEVHLPSGERERLPLDGLLGASVHALPLHLDGGAEAEAFGVKSQLFASAFASNEEALQDAAIANHMGLGDLAHLDLATTRITARVLLTTWAYQVTFVAVEEEGSASLVLLSHRRVHTGGMHTDGSVTQEQSVPSEGHGLLGHTGATGVELPLEAFVVDEDSVLATAFAHSLFQH